MLYIYTGNKNKQEEFKRIIKQKVSILDILTGDDEIQEIQGTVNEIAKDKCLKVYTYYKDILDNYDTLIVDDSGFSIGTRDGMPNAYSKEFLDNKNDRIEYFNIVGKQSGYAKCALSYIYKKEYGEIESNTLVSIVDGDFVYPRGDNGFGFDDIFIPKGCTKTLAEMSTTEKDEYSPRSRAYVMLLNHIAKKMGNFTHYK